MAKCKLKNPYPELMKFPILVDPSLFIIIL